ncbi:hypothetical protein FB45DRAFT_1033036 [Roridomyces roridus]|uniref:Uncharacterized protein n=1 Tax=Roridomyces roridus TaxID=1738132 RepID=A0AAD7FHK3_9AGAR|nr:hypothetical protein FB45DRAFT_1033036 [Roridomyces roridus]
MRFLFRPRAKRKSGHNVLSASRTAYDVATTSLNALRESADAYPPLKSAVGGVLALWDIAERAKKAKSDARDIALRTEKILEVIADAVPDPTRIPPPMLQSIESFTRLLDDIGRRIEPITSGSVASRLVRLNRNESILREIRTQLDEQYRDFSVASALRVEVQQAQLSVFHEKARLDIKQTRLDLAQVSACTEAGRWEVARTMKGKTEMGADGRQTKNGTEMAIRNAAVGAEAMTTRAIETDLLLVEQDLRNKFHADAIVNATGLYGGAFPASGICLSHTHLLYFSYARTPTPPLCIPPVARSLVCLAVGIHRGPVNVALSGDDSCSPLRGALLRVVNDGTTSPKVNAALSTSADVSEDNEIIFIVPHTDNILLIGISKTTIAFSVALPFLSMHPASIQWRTPARTPIVVHTARPPRCRAPLRIRINRSQDFLFWSQRGGDGGSPPVYIFGWVGIPIRALAAPLSLSSRWAVGEAATSPVSTCRYAGVPRGLSRLIVALVVF